MTLWKLSLCTARPARTRDNRFVFACPAVGFRGAVKRIESHSVASGTLLRGGWVRRAMVGLARISHPRHLRRRISYNIMLHNFILANLRDFQMVNVQCLADLPNALAELRKQLTRPEDCVHAQL